MQPKFHNAVVVDVVRSPVGKGKPGGSLSSLHPSDLLAQVLLQLIKRNDLDPGAVDDVLIGCVSQVGEQSAVPGRNAWLAAGFPEHVPAATIDRRCGSGQQAIAFAAQSIMSGACDIVVAGGVESMSRVPMGSARKGADPYGNGVNRRFAPGLVGQGVSAELVAAKWNLTRAAMDQYAVESHRRAAAAQQAGWFDNEIVPIETPEGIVSRDETIRAGSSEESLAGLKPSFEDEQLASRFPQINWSVTAGNSSQISDGAAAALIMSEETATRLNLKPRARFLAFDVRGDDPLLMLTAPITTTRRVLAKAGLRPEDIDHYEINEAFACVPLAWQHEIGVDGARLNPHGGAIALGHPLGASGARLFATLLNGLERSKGRYGLQAMCEAGGTANATLIERL
ncbi:thiolase family protein [Variovorax sp. DT-64]|uniref:thiolase family protein n=1 Tax=Variovorax sp. DT-64 TaxID=3396160 RepID=UPI003F1AE6C6